VTEPNIFFAVIVIDIEVLLDLIVGIPENIPVLLSKIIPSASLLEVINSVR
jgi:hypothetical protein